MDECTADLELLRVSAVPHWHSSYCAVLLMNRVCVAFHPLEYILESQQIAVSIFHLPAVYCRLRGYCLSCCGLCIDESGEVPAVKRPPLLQWRLPAICACVNARCPQKCTVFYFYFHIHFLCNVTFDNNMLEIRKSLCSSLLLQQ